MLDLAEFEASLSIEEMTKNAESHKTPKALFSALEHVYATFRERVLPYHIREYLDPEDDHGFGEIWIRLEKVFVDTVSNSRCGFKPNLKNLDDRELLFAEYLKKHADVVRGMSSDFCQNLCKLYGI